MTDGEPTLLSAIKGLDWVEASRDLVTKLDNMLLTTVVQQLTPIPLTLAA